MSFTTQDLQAYLAGTLDETQAVAVETALESDPALERRLMALDPLAAQLDGTSAAIAGPTEQQTTGWTEVQQLAPKKSGFGWAQMLAAACIGGVVAGAGAWFSAQEATPDWRANVATYQALYSPQTIAGLQFDDAALAAQLSDVGAQVGFSELGALTGQLDALELLRAQILAHEGQPLAQIVFASAEGDPVALCLMAAGANSGSDAIALSYRAGLASAAFETESHTWLLIGTRDEEFIAKTAAQVQASLALL